MKLPLSLVLLAIGGQNCQARSLQLHNRIVFTRGGTASGQSFFNLKNPTEEQIYTQETVWTMNSSGGGQQQVWHVPKGYGQFGGFSKNGKKALSFNRFNLYVHDLSTKNVKHLLVWSGGWGTYIGAPSFSPDGKQVLCEIGRYNGSVYSGILRLQANKSYSVNRGLAQIAIHPLSKDLPADTQWRNPCWSPNGKRVSIAGGISWAASPASPKCQTELWTMNSDGTQAQQLTQNPAWDMEPTWSPSGDKIAFVRRLEAVGYDNDGYLYSYNVWITDLQKRSEKQLTFLPLSSSEILARNFTGRSRVISTPCFSSDGRQIAFEQSTNDSNFSRVPSSIYRVGAEGENLMRLSDGRLIQWIA